MVPLSGSEINLKILPFACSHVQMCLSAIE
jgi:hypothetical protein